MGPFKDRKSKGSQRYDWDVTQDVGTPVLDPTVVVTGGLEQELQDYVWVSLSTGRGRTKCMCWVHGKPLGVFSLSFPLTQSQTPSFP